MSSGDALTGAEKRCEPTTWMMSPAVMYSFDLRTLRGKFFLGLIGFKRNYRHLVRHRYRTMFARLFEQGYDPFDFARRVFVGVSRVFRVVQNRVDQDGDGLRHAVKNQQLVGDEKNHRGRAQFVPGRARHDRLDVMNEFVADEANRATGEPRQTGQRHGPVFFHHALDDDRPSNRDSILHDPIPDGRSRPSAVKTFNDLAIFDDLDAVTGLPDDGARIAADE